MKKIIIKKERPLEYSIPWNIDEISCVEKGILVEISDDEFELLQKREMCKYENGKVVLDVSRKEQYAKAQEVEKLKEQLANTDYMAIKFAERAIDEAEYAPARQQRTLWRTRINELEA